ncbi:uncharacterized protein MONBRDRAFT_6909 [Monosiga brevicollis MX1]|uniref:Uncharacterized protein n=1 Tax=Monosiga brevicollis TaxID=81824 RepID=A9UUL7_MONBE|nr:uncharacterized protein MONBRDRAFT_6909 [Monosiga brevicollis MX1]EDQ91121.1 predicted protein [Monosiga brevicollis MX1]|eukprot:XP_001744418.1 hypothetical protein [Monosiga brevicollis MX1]
MGKGNMRTSRRRSGRQEQQASAAARRGGGKREHGLGQSWSTRLLIVLFLAVCLIATRQIADLHAGAVSHGTSFIDFYRELKRHNASLDEHPGMAAYKSVVQCHVQSSTHTSTEQLITAT